MFQCYSHVHILPIQHRLHWPNPYCKLHRAYTKYIDLTKKNKNDCKDKERIIPMTLFLISRSMQSNQQIYRFAYVSIGQVWFVYYLRRWDIYEDAKYVSLFPHIIPIQNNLLTHLVSSYSVDSPSGRATAKTWWQSNSPHPSIPLGVYFV